ncbi:MAG: hypothetical protein ABIN36_18480 [Ferruginibacter sp.]
MKKNIFLFLMLATAKCFAQVPEDAIRYSWFPQNGTARNMAIGAAMGSLGGDISAAYVNPAGLALYKTNEVVLTAGPFFNNNNANFRQSENLDQRNGFSFGPIGVVFGFPSPFNPQKSNAVAIAINQTANFNNSIHYKSLNNYSSFGEQFAEELAKSQDSISAFLFTNSKAPYSVAPAWNAFLIDTIRVNGVLQVRAAAERILDSGQALQQEMIKRTSGGIYEFAISFAENSNKKWLFGGTIGIPVVHYKSNTTFIETDTSSNRLNGFKSLIYTDNFKTTGVGANLKLGVIYRPKDYIRLGLAVHTPSFFLLKDTRTVDISTEVESDTGRIDAFTEHSTTYTSGQPGEASYYQTTPWKLMISGSYVFREIQDTRKQRAFITADIEYLNHRGSRFSNNNEDPTDQETAYNKALNKIVKHEFKGTFNFRAGGEIKFNTIMGRLGFAHYGNPYKDKALKGSRTLLSGGLGYRNKGFFIDLTYIYSINKDINMPYRLEDRANTFATIKQEQANVVATVGFKF